jgi:hypothetical protein
MKDIAEKFLTQVFLPINIGIAALFYTFAFTFFKNLLHELEEYLSRNTKKEKSIKTKKEYFNIVKYCHFGQLIMHLLFGWCTFSFLFGILGYYVLLNKIDELIYSKIILAIVFAFFCSLSVFLIYRDINAKLIGLRTALLLAVPTLGSLVLICLICRYKLSEILPIILLTMLIILVFYLLFWFCMSLKYTPLRSLQKLRGTVD